MRSPRVSVLLSVFNSGSFVGPAVASVLAQTGPSLELIAVDDASTDGSAELLQHVAQADGRLRVVRNSQNQGLVVNLNRGLELARGEFIARIDADDLHRPGKLAAQVAEMDASPSLVLLGTNFEYVDASGKVFKRESPETDRQLLKERLQADGNQFCHSSVMFRAEMARQIGGYRMLAGRYAQDYDLWLRLSERGEIGCLPGHLTAYRCHDEMLSLTRLAQQRRAAEIYKEIGRHRPLRHPIRRSLHPNTGCQLTVARLVENRCAALDRWALRRDPTYDWRSFKVYLKTQSFMSDMRREHTATACSNRLWPPPVSTSVAQGGRDRCA